MCRFTPVGVEDGPRLRRSLRAGNVVVEFAAGNGRNAHFVPLKSYVGM